MLLQHMHKSRYAPRLFLALFAVALAGCNAASNDPVTQLVTGIVTHQGTPVAGALVTFHAEGAGQNAVAYSDDNGAYSMMSYFDNGKQSKPGVVPGDYRVTVTKLDSAPASSSAAPPKNLLPDKYATPKNSGLTCKVTNAKAEQCDLKL